MSKPSPSSVRWIARTVATTSPSLFDDSSRSSLPSFGAMEANSFILPAPFAVAAHFTAPVVTIIGNPRQQLASAGSFDDGDRAVAPKLRMLGVERHQQMQSFTRVSIDGCEDRRVLDNIKICLIDRDLCRVVGIGSFEPVALDVAPALAAERFVLPNAWIADAGQRRSGCENAVGMAAKQSIDSREAKPISRRKREAGADEMLARQCFK